MEKLEGWKTKGSPLAFRFAPQEDTKLENCRHPEPGTSENPSSISASAAPPRLIW